MPTQEANEAHVELWAQKLNWRWRERVVTHFQLTETDRTLQIYTTEKPLEECTGQL